MLVRTYTVVNNFLVHTNWEFDSFENIIVILVFLLSQKCVFQCICPSRKDLNVGEIRDENIEVENR